MRLSNRKWGLLKATKIAEFLLEAYSCVCTRHCHIAQILSPLCRITTLHICVHVTMCKTVIAYFTAEVEIPLLFSCGIKILILWCSIEINGK